MDIYEEDNVNISSDEYDDSDDLLNVAVSSSNIKQETQKSTEKPSTSAAINREIDLPAAEYTVPRQTYAKSQPKRLRKLGIKLKKKSVKWMQQKFRRHQIRNRYLYSIARVKSINNKQQSHANSMRATSAGLVKELPVEQPKRAISAEENVPRNIPAAEKSHINQQETIDLDDTDDDDDDVDDSDDDEEEDEDDDSSTDISYGENDDEDIDEINNEEDEDVNAIDKADEKDEIIEEFRNNKAVENNVLPEAIVSNQEVHGQTNNKLVSNDEKPKRENMPENAVEGLNMSQPFYNEPNAQVFNSTVQEKMSQIKEEPTAIIPAQVISIPTIAPTMNTAQIPEAPLIIASVGVLESPRTIISLESRVDPHCTVNKTNNHNNNSNITANISDVEMLNISKNLGVEQSFFFNDELNAMYPNFDKIVNEHVKFPETAEIIRDRIKLIAADVEHINKALEIKEKECNQLLYVKHTKEQILARLMRKIKRNEVNTDQNAIEAIASRELGIVPKQTRQKEPPAKRRKLEPRTAQEILQQGANMSMDEVLRAKAQNNMDANFIDDTLKKFGISSFKPSAKDKPSLNKPKHTNKGFFETNLNLTAAEKQASHRQSGLPYDYANKKDQERATSTERSQHLLLNLLNADHDSDDTSISYNMRGAEQESALENLLDNWAAQRQQQRLQNSHSKEDDTYEVIIEKETPTKTNNSFPILNQNETTLPNTDETLVVHLNVSDFKDNNTSNQIKKRENIANNFICQHCGIHKAQYVCAECENQWYCSRSCQVKAWDSHCETCE